MTVAARSAVKRWSLFAALVVFALSLTWLGERLGMVVIVAMAALWFMFFAIARPQDRGFNVVLAVLLLGASYFYLVR